jgi:luciferase-type oxidoreductase
MIAGLSSGDRIVEYPLFGANFDERGADFRRHALSIRRILAGDLGHLAPGQVRREHAQPVPLPTHGTVPLLAIGSAQQPLTWIASNLDGFVTYPRPASTQAQVARAWRQAVEAAQSEPKPFAQSLYVDLVERPNAAPTPIHLGLRSGTEALTAELLALESIGVNHVMLNLKYGRRPAAEVIEHVAEEILPSFSN